MDSRTEGTLAMVAALLVLLSAMWDARASAAIAIAALVSLGVYKLFGRRR